VKKKDHVLTETNNHYQGENYLTVRMIDSSPSLAKQLPAELAHKYQAIPIASDLMSVTVAMADPADPVACESIRSAVQLPVTVVKGDAKKINSLITKYYAAAASSINLLAWTLNESFSPDHQSYIDYLATTLKANLSWMGPGDNSPDAYSRLLAEIKRLETDLLVCNVPPGSCLQNLAGIPGENKLLQHCSASILSLKIPRWPIQQILLILQDDEIDFCAVDWAIRLAIACQASLTILPVVPPPPLFYAGTREELPELLKSNCELGQHLRQIAHRLASWDVSGTFKLRNEPPEWQIRSEASERDFDLIIIGLEQKNLLEKIILKDLVNPLMYWATIPVLLAQTYPQGK
jgi:nucleotide-binding universal stress UspA family protein